MHTTISAACTCNIQCLSKAKKFSSPTAVIPITLCLQCVSIGYCLSVGQSICSCSRANCMMVNCPIHVN